jgi:tRNA pseudouridine55 synthase
MIFTGSHSTLGWIVIDKVSGVTSMHVTRKMKKFFQGQKIGHAGTLDPLASGILPLALGSTTSLIPFLMDYEKTYEFGVTWGVKTTTDDSCGEVCSLSSVIPTVEDIQSALPFFTGVIQQRPPMYSALKIKGQPAYTYARQGYTLILPQRSIHIESMDLIKHEGEKSYFRVRCQSGTYVRSLARDLATTLGTEGHVHFLRRTHVGPFEEKHAMPMDFLEEMSHKERMKFSHPPHIVLSHIPSCDVTQQEREDLWHGRFIQRNLDDGVVGCYHQWSLVALGQCAGGVIRPKRCFRGDIC